MEIRSPKVWSGRDASEEDAERILNAVLDAGINFIDTAGCYGLSEARIGRHISDRRDEYTIATKAGCNQVPTDDGRIETPHTWDRDTLLRNIEQSLERMKLDYVDIWQLHNATPDQVREGNLLEVMEEVKAQGLVKFISISSTLPHLDEYIKWGAFDTFQIPYSALEPEHHDVITRAAEAGMGIIIRGGIAKGGPESDVARADRVNLWEAAGLNELLPEGMSPAEMILRYTLTHPHCHTTIVGTLNPEHLAENVAAAMRGPLEPDLYVEIQHRVREARS
ncbi:MAG: aldo/keto reductase [Anaerolineae bacterium]|nr:aldo/keto reductase [Anaerolineae bacterium]